MGSGCASFDIGKSSKSARIDPNGSVHEGHSMWNFSDPFTAIGKFMDVNINVGVQTDCGGPVNYMGNYVENNRPGAYMDYRYNRWCTDGCHLERQDTHLYEVKNGCHLELKADAQGNIHPMNIPN